MKLNDNEKILKKALEESLKKDVAAIPKDIEPHEFSDDFIARMKRETKKQSPLIIFFKKVRTRRIAAAAIALVTVATAVIISLSIPQNAHIKPSSETAFVDSTESEPKKTESSKETESEKKNKPSKPDKASSASKTESNNASSKGSDDEDEYTYEHLEPADEEVLEQIYSNPHFLTPQKELYYTEVEGVSIPSEDMLNARWNDLILGELDEASVYFLLESEGLTLKYQAIPLESYEYSDEILSIIGAEYIKISDSEKTYTFANRDGLQYLVYENSNSFYFAKLASIADVSGLTNKQVIKLVYGIKGEYISSVSYLKANADPAASIPTVDAENSRPIYDALKGETVASAPQTALCNKIIIKLENGNNIILSYYPEERMIANEFGGYYEISKEDAAVIAEAFPIPEENSEETSSDEETEKIEITTESTVTVN